MPTVRLSDPTTRWEYRVASVEIGGLFGPNVDVNQLSDYLNGLGADGWELVSPVDLNRPNGASTELLLILKRPRRG
jgi:hypothetical protein